jgi:type VI secretion system protein ImpI
MAHGLYLRVRSGAVGFERAFARTPVMIGRNVGASQCELRDEQVSKLHASLDVQEGVIRARDVGSTNGTYVGGRRLDPNRWVAVGSAAQPVELQIAGFIIQASVYEDEAVEASAGSTTLAELLEAMPSSAAPLMKPDTGAYPARHAAGAQPSAGPAPSTYEMGGPAVRLMPLYGNVLAATKALHDAVARELEAAPPVARPHVCHEILTTYPTLTNDPSIQSLLRTFGWSGANPAWPGTSPLAVAALDAMQDLVGWYIGRNRVLAEPKDVVSFKERLRATLDEFLLGYVPLLVGMSRFEHQMAIRAEASAPMPSSPAELATKLLDWRTANDDLRQRLRASFAELMMHQVALLNGVMSGVKALLTELAPATIEKAAQRDRTRRGGLAGIFAGVDPWSMYKKRHSDLADEENERFRLLFGNEFVDEYRQFTRETRAAGPAPGAERPNSTSPPPHPGAPGRR